ncbi:MAG: hypothetical protein CSA65_09700 [Proteobacteria bacterium]|nr:MAG: hypothetical protein CSA65_09700 [Pseudomonadota bacterium]
MSSSSRPSLLLLPFLGLLGLPALPGCSFGGEDSAVGRLEAPLASKCTIKVSGKGTKDMENDYLPHVITCENGAAGFEALKAQAVAARSYAYYVTRNGGSIKDGQANQVYSCSAKPKQRHYDAVKATAGQVLRYQGTVICAFYVAGAKPSDTTGCVAKSWDSDPTHTETYVTYNEGKSGSGITQSKLGWVSSSNIYNRGCKSQNGANCLGKAGRDYVQILRFYYGADIELYQTTGSCVTPPADAGALPTPDTRPPPSPDTGTPPPPPPDTSTRPPPKHDLGAPKQDSWDAPERDSGAPAPPPDFGALPRLDSGSSQPAAPTPRYLAGGCAIDRGDLDDGGRGAAPLSLLLLLGLWVRRRR